MTTLFTIIILAGVFFLLVLLYALLKVSSISEMHANYMEEYGNDFDEDEEMLD